MTEVLERLDDGEAKKAYAVIRMDPDKPTNEFDKWCVLLDSRAHANGDPREEVSIVIREKAILSPTRRRLKSTGRPSSKWDDEVNL